MGLTWVEVCNMEAGEEMDALIAEKVMGWMEEILPVTPFDSHSAPYWCVNGEKVKPVLNWSPSSRIATAWEVVKQLSKDYGVFVYEDEGAPCECKLHKWSEEPTYSAEAETSPLAICRAALLTTLTE